MEGRKIGWACFIGGCVCSAVALMVTPAYWWLGLLAGFAGGYFGYEFREVLRMVPRAWGVVKPASGKAWRGLGSLAAEMVADARKWLGQPHPFLYFGMLLVSPGNVWCVQSYTASDFAQTFDGYGLWAYVLTIVGWSGVFLLTAGGAAVTLSVLAYIGSRGMEKCYFLPFFLEPCAVTVMKEVANLRKKGFVEKPLTYTNAARWIMKGVGGLIIFCVMCPVFFVLWTFQFCWHLFKLIHNHKRLLCGVDGMLGGAISYQLLAVSAGSLLEQMMLVFFGGLLGAGLGVLNWEIVSKRLLKVVPTNG